MEYNYSTSGVCSTKISFKIEGNTVSDVNFVGGCNGNLKAVSSLTDGLTVEQIESKCGGITCGYRKTSCPDQLAKAVRQAYDKQ
ncbi:MAG: TIGR03905 family TSCPD domain-containing protein [Christensenellaceae bacterium]|jgi:uncharacterized protein (TIGR03905 family)|nr:TIGR03905 family TSCPD domain-containing protein [Christensenellaceae bacterium]